MECDTCSTGLQPQSAFTPTCSKNREITYVSAFLCGQNPKRPYETYKTYFDRMAETGLPFVLFLDKRLPWSFPANVIVVPVLLAETWVYQTVSYTAELPRTRNPTDTLEYMLIQTTKTEWLARASTFNPWNTTWFAWVDFGLVHVFKDPDATLARMERLQPPARLGLRTTGIWHYRVADVWRAIVWRFAGGFLMGDGESLRTLDSRLRELVSRTPNRMTWEVNLWALLESEGLDMGWFVGSHDDTIIPFEETNATISASETQTEHSTR